MNDNKMKNWKRIWGNKYANMTKLDSSDTEEVFMELKRLTGNDTMGGQGVSYEAFVRQFEMARKEMSFSPINDIVPRSYFEVGCGSGALLYLLQKDERLNEKIVVGGVDYSKSFIEAAEKVLNNPKELYCSEASEIDTSLSYDCVFSYSAFEYFYDYEYAYDVMNKMCKKANHSVAILDIHDIKMSKAYDDYRRSIMPDYDEKYAELKKLFYDKSFFVDFADENELDIKITSCRLDGYWNAPFTFDVYLYKR